MSRRARRGSCHRARVRAARWLGRDDAAGSVVCSALSAAFRLIDEYDGRSLFDISAQQAGVPISQPNATMGFGFADFGRMGRTMDTISLRRQPDPVGSRRIIRPRPDRERLPGFDAFEFI